MSNAISVFISYRNTMLGQMVAHQLFEGIRGRNHNPYWDKDFIEAGDIWDNRIIESILDSDVLIVLLDEEVIHSEWVQREVDTARAAQIQVLPYLINPKIDSNLLEKVQKKLNIDKFQYATHTVPPDLDTLCQRLTEMAVTTRQAQQKRVEVLEQRWKIIDGIRPKTRAKYNISRCKFVSPGMNTQIHLATGGIHEFKNIDVIVNSENDHLQMSRIHEHFTVSSRLRHYGSWVDPHTNHIIEDSLQWELDSQVYEEGKGRPVAPGRVIVTNAGHPASVLRAENKIRYIFHAVTVEVIQDFRDNPMNPISGEGIKQCVIHCMEAVAHVNEVRGVISPKRVVMLGNRKLRDREEEASVRYQPIRSIVLPLLGTGHAGRPIIKTIGPIAEGIYDALKDNPDTTLTDIYLCVYYEDDVQTVQDALAEIFQVIEP